MFFQGLDSESYDREYGDVALLRRVARYFRAQGARMSLIVLVVLLVSVIQAAVPFLISQGAARLGTGLREGIRVAELDRLIEAGISALAPWTDDPTVWFLALAVTVAGLAVYALNYLRRRETSRAIGQVVLALRQDAFKATVGHDLSFYDTYASGRIVSRITTDTQELGQTVTLVADLVGQVAQVLLLVVVLWRISPSMTLLLIM